jgi:peptidyl-prolyl cis-trans isomerase SurA
MLLVRLLFCAFFMFGFDALAASNRIVATVGEKAITNTDVERRARLMSAATGMQMSGPVLNQALHVLIDEKLIALAAEKNGVELDAMEVESAWSSIAKQNKMTSVNQFKQNIKAAGIDLNEFSVQLEGQMLWSKILKTEIEPGIVVSDAEIEENKSIIIAEVNKVDKTNVEPLQVELAEIVLMGQNQDELNKAMQLAQKITADHRSGVEFSKLAEQFSQVPSAQGGGRIGWVYVNQLQPAISKKLANASKGMITTPIMFDDRISIIKVLNVKAQKIERSQLDDGAIKNMIKNKKLQAEIKTYLNKLRNNYIIEIKK